MTTANGDAVARAAAAVPRAHYTDHPRLGRVPQATAQTAIERDLRRADIQPGHRVLEIGTGTGLTGALIADLVGPDGHVVSVDIDPALIQRADDLHAERGVRNITLTAGDGHLGAPGHGPFDVIVAWCTPVRVPDAWTAQAAPGAVICTPVYIAEVARAVGHARMQVTADSGLAGPRLGTAVYVDMAGEINTSLGTPMHYIDAQARSGNSDLAWISVAWRGHCPGHDPAAALAMLREPGHCDTVPLGEDDQERALAWRDFRAYSAARDAAHPFSTLTSYGTAGTVWESGIGFSSGRNAAALMADGTLRANTATSPALAKLRDYWDGWEQASRPGLDDLVPVLSPHRAGWQVRTALPRACR
jgi:protein-L-isoaspartate(D-aspartate) O-methyltransferase